MSSKIKPFNKKNFIGMNIKGYEWFAFHNNIHSFQKKEKKGFSVIKCTHEQIYNGDIEFMIENEITI